MKQRWERKPKTWGKGACIRHANFLEFWQNRLSFFFAKGKGETSWGKEKKRTDPITGNIPV